MAPFSHAATCAFRSATFWSVFRAGYRPPSSSARNSVSRNRPSLDQRHVVEQDAFLVDRWSSSPAPSRGRFRRCRRGGPGRRRRTPVSYRLQRPPRGVVVEDRLDRRDVGEVGAAVVRGVHHVDVAGHHGRVVADRRLDRLAHRPEVHRHVGGVGDQVAARVEDGAAEVESLLDVDRHRGVLQHQAHLLGDVHEQVVEDLQLDRVDGGADRRPARQWPSLVRGRGRPCRCSSPATRVRRTTVPVASSTIAGSGDDIAGAQRVPRHERRVVSSPVDEDRSRRRSAACVRGAGAVGRRRRAARSIGVVVSDRLDVDRFGDQRPCRGLTNPKRARWIGSNAATVSPRSAAGTPSVVSEPWYFSASRRSNESRAVGHALAGRLRSTVAVQFEPSWAPGRRGASASSTASTGAVRHVAEIGQADAERRQHAGVRMDVDPLDARVGRRPGTRVGRRRRRSRPACSR